MIYPCCEHCTMGPDATPCGIPHDDPCDAAIEGAACGGATAVTPSA